MRIALEEHQTFPNFHTTLKEDRADLDLGQVDPKSLPISSRFHLHHLTSSYIPSGPSPLIKKDLIEATNPNTFLKSSRRRRVPTEQ